jgi:hypothetical protein
MPQLVWITNSNHNPNVQEGIADTNPNVQEGMADLKPNVQEGVADPVADP